VPNYLFVLSPFQRGGAHLGSITITGAQIGRQQRTERAPGADDEKEYRHAFLIVESKKGPGGNHPRHVLCAESDEDRDSWVEILVRYFTGTYSEEPVVKFGPGPIAVNAASNQNGSQPRSSTSSDSPSSRRPHRGFSKDDISISKGAAVPLSQLPQDESNAKLFQSVAPAVDDHPRSSSPSKPSAAADSDRGRQVGGAMDAYNARRLAERGQPSSLPDSSPLSSASQFPTDSTAVVGQRANSELGHYPDLSGRSNRQVSPERHRTREPHDKHKSFHPSLNPVAPSPSSVSPVDRIPSPDKLDKVKISGPLNGVPIPSGFKFGHKEGKEGGGPSEAAVAERRAKTRSFWGFGKMHGMFFFCVLSLYGCTAILNLLVLQVTRANLWFH
jgi:RalA-binding protein 1